MSPQPQRSFEQPSPQRGNFTIVPNSVIEHAHMFTHAEKILLELTLMRPGQPITDDKWREVSGLDADTGTTARMKLMAAKGLTEKGLTIQGKGQKATYRFDTSHWETWWRSRPRRERARTIGRGPTVKAKPGMQVHTECRERCQKLCEPPTKADVISISSAVATEVAKPVSQSQPVSPPPSSKPAIPSPTRENAKPVSQTSTQVNETITTQYGNKVPIEHLEAVNEAIHKANRRIKNARHGSANLEAHVIRETLAKLSATKSNPQSNPQPKPRSNISATAKADRLRAARDVLEHEAEHSKLEIEIAREIVNGSGQ